MAVDQELVARLRARDPRALEALVERYAADVHAVVAAILSGAGAQDVEDAAAEAFLAAWRHSAAYDPARAPVRAWLLMHARYSALEQRRRVGRAFGVVRLPEVPATSSPPDLAPLERRQRVLSALTALSPVDRQIVYRRYYLDQDTAAIATVMGLTATAVDNRLHRARRRLRALLADVTNATEEGRQHGP